MGFVILMVLTGLVTAAALELGRHTLWGWALAAAVFVLFLVLHRRHLAALAFLPRLGCFAALVVLLAAVLLVSRPPIRPVPAVEGQTGGVTEVVSVAQGDLTGVYTADRAVEVYAGIPYAAPPVGENRWRPPQAPESWQGVRACETFAPMSMQVRGSTAFNSLTDIFVYHTFRVSLTDNWLPPVSEDSLYLNIWKPAGELDKAPVLVYIHGGSLSTGQTWYSEYNGESFARRGIVVVNFAYRLNVFGYYAAEELLEESGTTGNYGLLDQIAALKWVRENIAAFGGDPDNVTLCGESAGASSVNALCVSPLSKGLFRRVIAESSGVTPKVPYHTFRSLAEALETGRDIQQEFGVSGVSALRDIPAERLVNTKHANSAMTVDGLAITEQPFLTYEKGENHEEALLNGFNVHEADLFSLFNRVTEENYTETLAKVLEDHAAEAAALYPAAPQDPAYRYIVDLGGSAKGSFDRVLSAVWFAYSHYDWSKRLAARGRPVWEYHFTKDNGSLGSNHAGELPYAFGNLDRHAWLYDESDRALSETMMDYWERFIRTGDPNDPENPTWPRWDRAEGQVLELGERVGMIEDPHWALYPVIAAHQEEKWEEQVTGNR